MKSLLGRPLGGSLIIAGTTLGAGLLAIPISSAHIGFANGALLMMSICALMSYGAFLTVEVNLHFNQGTNIATAANEILGTPGRILASLAFLLLHYALLAAYITGGSSIIGKALELWLPNIPTVTYQLAFMAILGSMILINTTAVDALNRLLFFVKFIFFFILIGVLLPLVQEQNLLSTSDQFGSVLAVIPVFVASFGYHGSMHSVINYIGIRPKQLTLAIIVGSLIPFAFYITWQYVSIGALSLFGDPSFFNVFQNDGNVGAFLGNLNSLTTTNTINWASNGFAATAIATSFLGVGLGLFDFFRQKAHISNVNTSKLKSTLLTFTVPTLFAIFYPNGFVLALGFAGVALTIIALILPGLITLKLRKNKDYNPTFKTPGGKLPIYLAIIAAMAIIAAEFIPMIT